MFLEKQATQKAQIYFNANGFYWSTSANDNNLVVQASQQSRSNIQNLIEASRHLRSLACFNIQAPLKPQPPSQFWLTIPLPCLAPAKTYTNTSPPQLKHYGHFSRSCGTWLCLLGTWVMAPFEPYQASFSSPKFLHISSMVPHIKNKVLGALHDHVRKLLIHGYGACHRPRKASTL